MGMKIGELFMALGFDVDDAKLKAFSDQVSKVEGNMLKLSGGAIGALYGFNAFIQGSIQGATALKNLSAATDENIDTVQRWQAAGHLSNIALSYDDVAASILHMNQALSALSVTGENANIFNKLGINAYDQNGSLKKGTQILDEIRHTLPQILERYKGLGGKQGFLGDLGALGINPNMLQALQLSDAAFDKLAQDAVARQAIIDQNVETGQEIEKLIAKLNKLKGDFVASLGPDIEKGLDSVIPHLTNIYNGMKAINDITHGYALPAIIAFVAAFNPLTQTLVIVLALAKALEQIGKALDPAESKKMEGKRIDQIHDLMDWWNGKSKKDFWDIFWNRDPASGKAPNFEDFAKPDRGPTSGQNNTKVDVNVNPTYHIQSAQTPDELATALQRKDEQDRARAYQQAYGAFSQ